MKSTAIDRVGIVVSLVCVLHCILLPVSLTVLPMLAIFAEDERIHKALVILAAFPAYFAFFGLSRKQVPMVLKGLAVLGVLVLIMGAFVEALHDAEMALTLLGAISLASAHLWNSFGSKRHGHS